MRVWVHGGGVPQLLSNSSDGTMRYVVRWVIKCEMSCATPRYDRHILPVFDMKEGSYPYPYSISVTSPLILSANGLIWISLFDSTYMVISFSGMS